MTSYTYTVKPFDTGIAMSNHLSHGDDNVQCAFCGEHSHVSGLVGERTNSCPSCGKPVFIRTFHEIPQGTVFICTAGLKWVKISNSEAVLVVDIDEENCTGHVGQVDEFGRHDFCAPY